MNELDQFAMAALHGTAASALESEFLAQRAYDIARACVEISNKSKPDVKRKSPKNFVSNLPDVDTSVQRLTRCGKYTIPSDDSVLELLSDSNGPMTANEITKTLNTALDKPCKMYSILSILERLDRNGKVFAKREPRPAIWSILENDVSGSVSSKKEIPREEKPKPKKQAKAESRNERGYDKSLEVAIELGYKNVAEAVAVLGNSEFIRVCTEHKKSA